MWPRIPAGWWGSRPWCCCSAGSASASASGLSAAADVYADVYPRARIAHASTRSKANSHELPQYFRPVRPVFGDAVALRLDGLDQALDEGRDLRDAGVP